MSKAVDAATRRLARRLGSRKAAAVAAAPPSRRCKHCGFKICTWGRGDGGTRWKHLANWHTGTTSCRNPEPTGEFVDSDGKPIANPQRPIAGFAVASYSGAVTDDR